MRWLTTVGVVVVVAATVGCGAADPAPSPTPSPTTSSHPVVHAYPEQGFSLAIPDTWHALEQPSSADEWQLDVTPRVDMNYFPMVGVTVERSDESWTPEAFQQNPPKRYIGILESFSQAFDTEAAFEPVTLNGTPALRATYNDGTFEKEWYLVGNGNRIYSIGAGGEQSKWPSEAPQVHAIVDSFTLLGG